VAVGTSSSGVGIQGVLRQTQASFVCLPQRGLVKKNSRHFLLGGLDMSKKLMYLMAEAAAVLILASGLRAQSIPGGKADAWWNHHDKWNTPLPDKAVYKDASPAPAPRREISGTWDGLAEGGTQAKGPKEFPDDASHKPEVPYTALGKAARMRNKPGEGEEQVAVGDVNDPVDSCDPLGFPRSDLFSLKAMAIVQTPNYVVWLNQYYNVFRIIWTDGRELPKDPVPRYYGYSVGHWEDDYTFVVETVGMDERTWVDNVGRPHSSDLRVVERFHRPSRDILELTVTLDDPKMYTKPWVAANKLTLHLLPADFDMGEMICSPSEMSEYKKQVANPVADGK
jgi:hypothetical protein